MRNQRWRPRNDCDGRLMAKNFNNNNSGEFVFALNSPELLLLNFLSLTYHRSHFLAATFDFKSFFTLAFLGAALFFYSLAVLV